MCRNSISTQLRGPPTWKALHVKLRAECRLSRLKRLKDVALEHDAEIFVGHDGEAFAGYDTAPAYYS